MSDEQSTGQDSVAAAALTVLPSFTRPAAPPRLTLLRRRGPAPEAAIEDVSVPTSPAALVAVEVPRQEQPSRESISAPTVTELQHELSRERARADAAEAAAQALRRKVAQLDDELSQFRPRAVVPFEDNTD